MEIDEMMKNYYMDMIMDKIHDNIIITPGMRNRDIELIMESYRKFYSSRKIGDLEDSIDELYTPEEKKEIEDNNKRKMNENWKKLLKDGDMWL